MVILGKPGVGKSTIGNQLIGCDLFQVGVDYETATNYSQTGELKVHLINTTSPTDQPRSRTHKWCKKMMESLTLGFVAGRATQPEEYYRSGILQSASLVIFVFRQERFTEDTKTQFEAAISVLGENASRVSALVITCCEGKTQEAKESIIKDFKTNLLTKDIAKFMQRGIYCVGFPDKTKIATNLVDIYAKDTEQSQKIVKSLVTKVSIQIMDIAEVKHSSRGACSCNVQ